MAEAFMAAAEFRRKGNLFEDFFVGQTFRHHWGRTINAGDNSLFTTLTLNFVPLYFNAPYARAHGHKDVVVAPLLVFNIVLGLSVEDLSEIGGPFVGVDDLEWQRPVYPGDTLTAETETIATRTSDSKPEFGLVTWRTIGRNQDGDQVIGFTRTNLVRKQAAGAFA